MARYGWLKENRDHLPMEYKLDEFGDPIIPQLTVAQVIAELQKMPPDAFVMTEGCDCNGEAGFVYFEDGYAMIARTNADYFYRIRSKQPDSASDAKETD